MTPPTSNAYSFYNSHRRFINTTSMESTLLLLELYNAFFSNFEIFGWNFAFWKSKINWPSYTRQPTCLQRTSPTRRFTCQAMYLWWNFTCNDSLLRGVALVNLGIVCQSILFHLRGPSSMCERLLTLHRVPWVTRDKIRRSSIRDPTKIIWAEIRPYFRGRVSRFTRLLT